MPSSEAAALIVSEFLPEGGKACAFGLIDGPLAPCELLKRPELRDYATFLASAGLTALGVGDPAPKGREGEAEATRSEAEEGLDAEKPVAKTLGDEATAAAMEQAGYGRA